MKRRAFLGFLGGAVAAGPTAAKAAVDDLTLKQAGFSAAGQVVGAAPNALPSIPEGAIAKTVRWIRRTGIPTWKMNDLKRHADHLRQFGLDPDLAALRSVSGGWKAREQRRRNLERAIEFSLASIGRDGARRAYEDKVQSKFGGYLSWYD